jgi:hypothetical protein
MSDNPTPAELIALATIAVFVLLPLQAWRWLVDRLR